MKTKTDERTATPISADDVGFWSFVSFACAVPDDALPEGVDRSAMQLFMTLTRAKELIFYDLRAPVRESGISETGFSLMFILSLVGEVSIKRLVELSGSSKASCSAAIRTLTADGLVARNKSRTDGRAILVQLTPKGTRAIQEVYPQYNEREQKWASTLSDEDRDHLIRILNQLMQNGKSALRRSGPAN